MKLHIGGSEKKEGWHILDIQPGPDVDIVADIEDLSALEEGACSEIYASHVLEHIPYSGDRLLGVLKGLRRILASDGVLKASVPDMDTLCWLFVSPRVKLDSKFHVMRIMFGGQVDAHDFHYVGLSFDILQDMLRRAGFSRVERVAPFGLFDDSSAIALAGIPVSLNIEARP